ncbi:MAG: hypothetical protein PHW87_07815 [Methanothrix sp.]|nr:hypothetical protein [Methanothrix sp.]
MALWLPGDAADSSQESLSWRLHRIVLLKSLCALCASCGGVVSCRVIIISNSNSEPNGLLSKFRPRARSRDPSGAKARPCGCPALLPVSRKDRQAGGLHQISLLQSLCASSVPLCLCGEIVSCSVIIIS